ncbi:helix-turn-helix domain-containing protein [Plantactinospora sp. GCM10030261]|uniref:helix-turn-helix domain-containing protein n=1 Tax=Plantactinospora sp. GCM10030261 TaxID=3273420 RepID=UPI00360B1901
MSSGFQDDLNDDLTDPDFLRSFVTESVRIATVDAIINALDDARTASGLSKADVARAIGAEPATVRRLFSAGNVNPTLGTLAAVAAALGLHISVRPMSAAEREAITEPLRTGRPPVRRVRPDGDITRKRQRPAA